MMEEYPSLVDIALGTAIVIVCMLVPAIAFVLNISSLFVGIFLTIIPIFGMAAGGWYTARRSNGGTKAGATAGIVPGAYILVYVSYITLTEDVGTVLATELEFDPEGQLVPPSVLFVAFGAFLVLYVIGLAAFGGFIARYVPLTTIRKRIL
ncbi:hypothetical protein [Natronorubrum tibetense]|nr:hypothetical protein [Natronorubrum tibetense]